MKITLIPDHNRVIATGTIAGKHVKSIVVCNEDKFDAELGADLAKRKYKIAEKVAKKSLHESNVRALKDAIKWCENSIANEQLIINGLDERIESMNKDYHSYLESKFGE